MAEKLVKLDTKTKYLYENFRQMTDIYKESIIEAYEKIFGGSLKGETFTPAELLDNIAMVAYEIEASDEQKAV